MSSLLDFSVNVQVFVRWTTIAPSSPGYIVSTHPFADYSSPSLVSLRVRTGGILMALVRLLVKRLQLLGVVLEPTGILQLSLIRY